MTDVRVEEAIVAVKRLFLEVFERGKVDLVDEIVTEDFRFQYPFPGFAPGPEGIKEFTKVFHRAFGDFQVEIHEIFGGRVDDKALVTIRWTFRGTHGEPFLGATPTGAYVTVHAIGIYVWGEHKKLQSGWLELNSHSLLHQLGLLPSIEDLLPGLRGQK
jgi:SnoaL-like polyketide cyclase